MSDRDQHLDSKSGCFSEGITPHQSVCDHSSVTVDLVDLIKPFKSIRSVMDGVSSRMLLKGRSLLHLV